jgi:hypothetical protein
VCRAVRVNSGIKRRCYGSGYCRQRFPGKRTSGWQKFAGVISEVQGYAYQLDASRDVHLRYVGKAGEQYFLYSPEVRSVLVLPIAEAKVIELKMADGKESTAIVPINAPVNAPVPSP